MCCFKGKLSVHDAPGCPQALQTILSDQQINPCEEQRARELPETHAEGSFQPWLHAPRGTPSSGGEKRWKLRGTHKPGAACP